MGHISSRSVWMAGIALLVAGAWGAALAAPAPPEQAPPPGDDGEKVTEKSIYIPYEKLREVFEKKGRGVFLPYEEFLELWKAARKAHAPPEEIRPPVDALVTELAGVATVAKDVVTVKADVRIELLKEGWHEVPLRLADVAVTRATLGGEPARLVFDSRRGYVLLVEKKGEAPKLVTLKLEFAKAYSKTPGRNRVSFQSPLAPVSKWDVTIPEPGVEVNVHPMLAATEVPPEPGAEETHVLAFVGAAPEVRFEWTPKAEGAKGLEALASVKAEQEVRIDEGVTRTRTRLAYEISRAEIATLTVDVPADQKVVNVFDPNVREWSVEPAPPEAGQDARQRVTVHLFEPARGTQNLIVELEKFTTGGDGQVVVPVVRAVGVGRQMGVVVVQVASGLRAEAERSEKLLQLDAGELPANLKRTGWDFAYRYATLPFGLALSVEKIQPRILVTSLAEVHLQPESLALDFLAVYDVQRAGVFRLAVDLPEGYEVRHVGGVGVGGAKPAAVDTHHVEGRDPKRLVVNLSRRAMGKVALEVKLHRPLQEPDLLAPTGQAATVTPALPRVRDVERETGRMVVYAPESLHVNPSEATGLRTISHAEAVQGLRSTQGADEKPVLAYAYTDEPASLVLAAERRKPHVTVAQLLEVRVESGVVKYAATFDYQIRYSGVRGVRIDVPAILADEIRVTTSGVRKRALEGEDAPADLAEGYVAWHLERETELIGGHTIRLAWETKVEKLDTGEPVSLEVPRLVPRGVDRAWGQVVLAKGETIDVTAKGEPVGLRPIDPHHDLHGGRKVEDAAVAFEFYDEWSLAVEATRYEPMDVKATAIERALVRMVVTPSDETSVQAIYRMRSVRQRLAVRFPETEDDDWFESLMLWVNGERRDVERGAEGSGRYFIPLVGLEPDEPFLVELRYAMPGKASHLEPPTFPDEPAVQQVWLSVYVPQDRTYLGKTGPWNDVFTWHVAGFRLWPESKHAPRWLVNQVAQGTGVDQARLMDFAAEGRHLLFSTLRPEGGDAGSLHVYTVHGTLFAALVTLVILAIGGWLLRKRLAERVLVVGVLIVVWVFLWVFMPSFWRALFSNAAAAACLAVAIVWIVWYVVVTRPRDPSIQARAKARQEARIAEAQARAEAAQARREAIQSRRGKRAEKPPAAKGTSPDEGKPPPGTKPEEKPPEGESPDADGEGGGDNA